MIPCFRSHRLRYVQILRLALVEAIRFKLQGHHLKPVMLGQVRIGGLKDACGRQARPWRRWAEKACLPPISVLAWM